MENCGRLFPRRSQFHMYNFLNQLREDDSEEILSEEVYVFLHIDVLWKCLCLK